MFVGLNVFSGLRRADKMLWRDQSGFVLPLVALIIVPLLLGFTALGIDLGFAFSRQRQMQVAADGAAYSGAASLVQNYDSVKGAYGTTYYATEAQNTAAAAGFTTGVENITVTPSLNAAGDTVTVTISDKRKWILASIVMGYYKAAPKNGFNNVAQAVAKVEPVNNYCILALGCSAKKNGYGIEVQGNTSVTSPNGGCGMASDCTSSCSINQTGSANTVGMPAFSAGGNCVSGNATFNVTDNASITSDPFSKNGFDAWLGSIAWPKKPGNWTSGTPVPNSYYDNFSPPNGTTNLPAGIYYIEGSMTMNGGSNLTGANVTLIFGPNASISVNGNTSVTITAPTSGPTAGVQLAGLATTGTIKLLGNSGYGGQGAVYFPKGDVEFTGSNVAGGQCLKIVANTVAFQGDSNIQDNCNAGSAAQNFKIRLIQ